SSSGRTCASATTSLTTASSGRGSSSMNVLLSARRLVPLASSHDFTREGTRSQRSDVWAAPLPRRDGILQLRALPGAGQWHPFGEQTERPPSWTLSPGQGVI